MKENYIEELKAGMEITDFFMVKSVAVRLGSNKKQYLDLTLADKTGEISAKKWDITEQEIQTLSEIKDGDLIKAFGNTVLITVCAAFLVLFLADIRLRSALRFSSRMDLSPALSSAEARS